MRAEVSPEALYKRRAGRFATKIRNSMKKNGLRSGELLLEFWSKPNPSPSSLEKIGLKVEDVIEAIEQEIAKYKTSLPTQ